MFQNKNTDQKEVYVSSILERLEQHTTAEEKRKYSRR